MRKFHRKGIKSISLSKVLFIYSLCVLSFAFGYLSLAGNWFPHKLISNTVKVIERLKHPTYPEHIVKTDSTEKVPVYQSESTYDGLSLVTSGIDGHKVAVSVIDMEGELIHRWNTDWFDLWPDQTHIPKSDPFYPKTHPGTLVHGAVLLENGDLIFNFDYLGLIKLDVCGNVIWRLPYRTHHSIYLDEHENLWVSGRIVHHEADPNLPFHKPPFYEPTVLKISLDGEILNEISVIEIIKRNGLHGLLYLSNLADQDISVTGDTMHLNDVETFPSYLDEGVFKTGDIMISLRNINTVLIFREEDLKVTHVSTGEFVRQHDPDFIDGNTISIFDNIGPEENDYQSRILVKSFVDGEHSVHYSGAEDQPFHTGILGKHQWLPNGNVLITESMKGRAVEIDERGNIIWEFINIIRPGYAGITEEVQRLPGIFTIEYFDQLTRDCRVD